MKLTARQSTASFGPNVPSTWRLERRAVASAVFLVLVFLVSAAPAFAGPSIAVMTPQTGPERNWRDIARVADELRDRRVGGKAVFRVEP